MTLTFNAIDVETANADRASICQIGIVHVRDGVIADHWHSLINPNAWFDPLNVSIHGINANDVRNSPSFSDIRRELDRLSESILISHTSFDRVALERALKEHSLEPLRVTWLDSARIVRRAWPEQYGKSGWGLKNVAANLDIFFNHHDALEDAKAAAEIVLRACTATDTGIADWLHLVDQPIFPPSDSTAVSKPEANPDGSLYGETILFTGELSVARRKAGELAAQAGCKVVDNASKKVTMLVVGTQDESKLRGYGKSSTHRKIEALINKGSNIEILSESDFFDLIGINRAEMAASKKSPPPTEKKPRGGIEMAIVYEDDEQHYDVDIFEDADIPFGEIVTYVEGASRFINNLDGCGMDDSITLVREPDNQNDSNAVMVCCKEKQIGYLPHDLAKKMGVYLISGGDYEAFLEEDWKDVGEDDTEENNVGLIIRLNLDAMPNELLKEGRKAELPTKEALESVLDLIEDPERGR